MRLLEFFRGLFATSSAGRVISFCCKSNRPKPAADGVVIFIETESILLDPAPAG